MNDNEILLQHLKTLDADIREMRREMHREITVLRTNIRVDTNEIREDIQELNQFRFRIYGIASFLSAAIGYAVAYFKD